MTSEHRTEQLQKAADWLNAWIQISYRKNDKDGHIAWPVAANRRGFAEFVAYVFKIKRDNKPSIWYCIDMAAQWEVARIKRICTY